MVRTLACRKKTMRYYPLVLLLLAVCLSAGVMSCYAASSTNVASGNLSHSQLLFATQGAPQSVSLSFFYNSLSSYSGPLGPGWSHSYDTALHVNSDGTVSYRGGDGERRLYTLSGSAYVSSPGDHSALVKSVDSTFTISYRDGHKENFYSNGKIKTIVDRYGNTLTFSYRNNNPDDDMTGITDSAQRSTIIDYDLTTTPHRIKTITDPAQNVYAFTYQENNLWRVTNPLVDTATGPAQGYWEYTYDPQSGLLKTKRDPNNNTTQYDYYADYRIKSATDPEGITNPTGHQRTLVYNNEEGTIKTTTFTEKDGGVWTYVYDTHAGVLKQKIAPNPDGSAGGAMTAYVYYADGSLKAMTEPAGTGKRLTTFYAYDGNGNLTSETDPLDLALTQYAGIDAETVDTATFGTDTSPIKWAFIYDYEYDTTFQYDRSAKITDKRGAVDLVTTYSYDTTTEPGVRIVKVTGPENKAVTYRYNISDGTIKSINAANNLPVAFTYNANKLPASVTDKNGVITKINTYDSNGNPTQSQKFDTSGKLIVTTDLTYDALSRLRTVTDTTTDTPPIVTVSKYDYDLAGNLIVYTDPETKQTKYEYNYTGQVTKITDPDLKETRLSYGGTGCTSCGGGVDKLTEVFDAKQIANNWPSTTYFYDKLGRLEREADPRGKTIRYEYYDNGLVKQKIDASAVPEKTLLTYEYNNQGQLTKKLHASGFTDNYEYDANGRLWKTSNPNISYTLEWYKDGKLKSVTDNTGKAVAYEYDSAGNMNKMTAPDGIPYYVNYDRSNRPYWLYSPAGIFDLGYDRLGRLERISWGWSGNPAITYSRDGLDRISNIKRTDYLGQVLSNIDYGYYPSGNVQSRTDITKSSIYQYDNLYRLNTVTTNATLAESYTYDEVGNRVTGPTAATSYAYSQGNQLDSKTGATFEYDDYGNLKKKIQGTTTYTYVYDDENRLKTVEKRSGTILAATVSMVYDPFGRRIERNVLKGSTETVNRYVYDNDNILYEYDGTGQLLRRMSNHPLGIDFPIAYNTDTSAFYYFRDALGSVNFVTDQNGTAVAEYSYDSFGTPTKTRLGSQPQPFSYTGREYDTDAALYYYRARYYDPTVGRFIQKDPIGLAGGINLYPYVQNNPINFIDPTGLSAITNVLPIAGGFAAADGPLPIGDIIAGGLIVGATAHDLWQNWKNSSDDPVVYPDNPDTAPERFRPRKGGGKVCDDGSVWDKDHSSHGGDQWKRWPNGKDFDKGRKPTSVWPDGRIRK